MLVLLTVAGCSNSGPQQMPADQFDYSKAIARSTQAQMLLNIVRVRSFDMPVFLGVSSVLTQYGWQGTVGVSGQQDFNIGFRLLAPERTAAATAMTQTVSITN